MTFPPAGLVIGGGALFAIGAAGAGVPSTRLKKFEEAIKVGEFLVLVDVKRDRVDEIEELVKKHHPEADIEGTEPKMPILHQSYDLN